MNLSPTDSPQDNRVRATLLEGCRDLQNILVHLQMVLGECGLPIVRSGGGLTFSGFSFQVAEGAPVDWMGYHIDRPTLILYQIQDRLLPKDCPLTRLKRLQARQYERTFSLSDSGFFDCGEREQMDLLKTFLQETVDYLRSLPPEDESEIAEPFIPVLGE